MNARSAKTKNVNHRRVSGKLRHYIIVDTVNLCRTLSGNIKTGYTKCTTLTHRENLDNRYATETCA